MRPADSGAVLLAGVDTVSGRGAYRAVGVDESGCAVFGFVDDTQGGLLGVLETSRDNATVSA